MRTLLLLGLAVGGAFMAGWFTIEREGDRTRIEINKTEIRSDTRQAIDKGRDLLEKREQERLAQQQAAGTNYGQNPAANTGQSPWANQGGTVQGAGYAQPAQSPYGQGGYPQQPYAQPPGAQPQYGGQSGYNPNYPVPNGQQTLNQQPTNPQFGNQQQAPRWTEMPPPWQQQTR